MDEVAGGRFRSWIAPDVLVVHGVAEDLVASADRVGSAAAPTRSAGEAVPDHLQRWLEVRDAVAWLGPNEAADAPVTPERDGAAEDIAAFDGALDPSRARALLTALEHMRADAARGAVLDFALLAGWQRHIAGTSEPPPFRNLPAFAKDGRERYGLGPDTRARLDTCLGESGGVHAEQLSLASRAARTYLDVCFFHPFDDGNARSAFLALLFVLAREGVALDSVSLLRRVGFRADSALDALALVRYIAVSVSETRRIAGGRQSGAM